METIPYFGFGANAHPHMIEAIIGRLPEGEPAVLQGFALVIQSLKDIPDQVLLSAPVPLSPRHILQQAWGNDFQSYTVRRDEARDVWGTVWHISRTERELVANWELIPFGWSSKIFASALFRDGRHVTVSTEWVYDQPVDRIVEGRRYPYFILPKESLCRAAQRVRYDFSAAETC